MKSLLMLRVHLAINCLTERWAEIEPHTAVKKDLFFKAISLCLRNSYLVYDGKTYSQIRGLAMGSPLSLIISKIVIDKLYISVCERFNTERNFFHHID